LPDVSGQRDRVHVVRAALAAAVLALALSGCGIGIGGNKTSKRVDLRVTTGFGTHAVGSISRGTFQSGTSIMAFTKQFFTLKTSDGGGFVDAINGHVNDEAKRVDWFYYINGIQASMGASATSLQAGDHVWWDLHDWRAAENVPAVVGSYPEPFLNGSGGQAYPTVVTCASGLTGACNTVTQSLSKVGVKVSFQGLCTGSGSDSLAVLVGTFTQLQGTIAAELMEAPRGNPKTSGVYAQFLIAKQGQALELDNPAGDIAATYHGSIGLVAAIEQPGLNEPVWLVSGTDTAGVEAAAKALTVHKLANHFAVAVLPGGKVMPLPLAPTS
jgi:hypothetical protein